MGIAPQHHHLVNNLYDEFCTINICFIGLCLITCRPKMDKTVDVSTEKTRNESMEFVLSVTIKTYSKVKSSGSEKRNYTLRKSNLMYEYLSVGSMGRNNKKETKSAVLDDQALQEIIDFCKSEFLDYELLKGEGAGGPKVKEVTLSFVIDGQKRNYRLIGSPDHVAGHQYFKTVQTLEKLLQKKLQAIKKIIMNKVFTQLSFWKLFTQLEYDRVNEEEIETWMTSLEKDFQVKQDNFDYQHDNQNFEGQNKVVVFEFDCGPDFALQLEYTPHPEGSDKFLYLYEKKSAQQHLMGWWDLGRWHPYALHVDELHKLLDYWEKNDDRWSNRELPLILLHDFVGLENNKAADDFSLEVFKAYEQLEIKGFAKAKQKPIAIFVYEDCQYKWKDHPKLGKVFDSGVYACYSIRNPAHEHSDEGRFPFDKWSKLMKSLSLQSS